MTTETKISYDIDDVHGSVSGTHVSLYLIPSAESKSGEIEITTIAMVGSGTPERAYHSRWLTLASLGTQYVPASLQSTLEGLENEIRTLDAAYLGSEWNGNNHVGKWEDDLDGIIQRIADRVTSDMVVTYWDADDWFSPIDASKLNLELASITEIAEAEIASAAGDAALDLDDCRKAIRGMIQRAAESLEEETDEDNAELLATYARLLATD